MRKLYFVKTYSPSNMTPDGIAGAFQFAESKEDAARGRAPDDKILEVRPATDADIATYGHGQTRREIEDDLTRAEDMIEDILKGHRPRK